MCHGLYRLGARVAVPVLSTGSLRPASPWSDAAELSHSESPPLILSENVSGRFPPFSGAVGKDTG
jgi:hypothetical protein